MTVSDWLKGVASKQWHATWAIVSIPVCSVDAVAPPGPGAVKPPGPGAVEPPGAWWRKFLEGGTAVPSSEECRPGVPSGRTEMLAGVESLLVLIVQTTAQSLHAI